MPYVLYVQLERKQLISTLGKHNGLQLPPYCHQLRVINDKQIIDLRFPPGDQDNSSEWQGMNKDNKAYFTKFEDKQRVVDCVLVGHVESWTLKDGHHQDGKSKTLQKPLPILILTEDPSTSLQISCGELGGSVVYHFGSFVWIVPGQFRLIIVCP